MKANQVVTNIAQDFTAAEKAQGRANIDAAEQKGFVECYRRFNDSGSDDTWFKVCELSPGTSDSYAYEYELALKLVCTNNGDGDCPCESASVSLSYDAIPAVNVGRAELAWNDHIKSSHAESTILGIKVLSHRASNNYGPRDKVEVWVKASQYMTYYTHMRIECLMNAGAYCYRGTYSTPSKYTLPWSFANALVTGTHTDPFNDANHPAASGYGAEGWSEVWYPVKTNTVAVDRAQDFTEDEKAQARANIGVSGNAVQIKTYQGAGAYGPVYNTATEVDLNRNSGNIFCKYEGGAQEEYGFFAPPPASGDNGKVLSAVVTENGKSVQWIDNPASIEMQTIQFDMNNDGACTKLFKQWQLPYRNGKYPSKVIGSISVCPETGRKVSIVPLAQYWPETIWDQETQSYIPNPNSPEFTQGSQCLNQHYVLDGYDVSGEPNFTNHLNFAFYQTEDNNLQAIGLKGLSNESNIYNENMVITCFWEK